MYEVPTRIGTEIFRFIVNLSSPGNCMISVTHFSGTTTKFDMIDARTPLGVGREDIIPFLLVVCCPFVHCH